jgi:hypothetical protein
MAKRDDLPPAAKPPSPRYATARAAEAGDLPTVLRQMRMGYGIGGWGRRRKGGIRGRRR